MHRDIKPANIFLSSPTGEKDPYLWRCKLGDFGIARSLNHSRALVDTLCGTPAYTSPERCAGGLYGPPSDVWGIGLDIA